MVPSVFIAVAHLAAAAVLVVWCRSSEVQAASPGRSPTSTARLATMSMDRGGSLRLIEGKVFSGKNAVAWANFTNAVNQTGWSYLEIHTGNGHLDKAQAFSAGFLEGYITADIIYMYWKNTVEGHCDGSMAPICEKVARYVHDNTKWVSKKVQFYRTGKGSGNSDSPKGLGHLNSKRAYWHHVGLFYEQLRGLEEGYKARVANSSASMWSGEAGTIPPGDIFMMNIFGDLEDLSQAFKVADGDRHMAKYRASPKFSLGADGHVLGSGSCSALVKLAPGNQDIFVAHDTWNSYQSMLRMLKRYNMELSTDGAPLSPQVPGVALSFSGYPGVIYSGDDFTLTAPSQMATLETTIGNSNSQLWKYISANGTVLEGARATVANRLAKNGKEWTRLFARFNSGTYNNQWMVVDLKKFRPGTEPQRGLLWVLEQLPGHVHADDLTSVLTAQTYWPSYNSPYYPDIFNLSGAPLLVEKYGDWFSYDKTPRALIFARDHSKVVDLASAVKLMRYNKFREDPLSACNCTPPYSAENAISARNDLNPANGTYPFGALGHRSHGGTDTKVTNYAMSLNGEFLAVSSPTYDDLPPFQWSRTDFAKDTPHFGHPDKWDFAPVHHKWALP